MIKQETIALLKKYIRHVLHEEGITFINRLETDKSMSKYSIIFTEEEANFLRMLEKQMIQEDKKENK